MKKNVYELLENAASCLSQKTTNSRHSTKSAGRRKDTKMRLEGRGLPVQLVCLMKASVKVHARRVVHCNQSVKTSKKKVTSTTTWVLWGKHIPGIIPTLPRPSWQATVLPGWGQCLPLTAHDSRLGSEGFLSVSVVLPLSTWQHNES